jgi:hypothetical protein
MNNEKNLKDHLTNLINALTNLSPSRNIISQLILLTPEDQATLNNSFPEVNISEFREVLRAMGIVFGDKIECVKDSFAETIIKLIDKTFDWLDDEYIYFYFDRYSDIRIAKMDNVRPSLAKLTGPHIDLIPNPYLEWIKLVIEKLSHEYGKDKIAKILKELLTQLPLTYGGHYKGKTLQEFIDEIGAKIRLTPSELKEICELIIYSEGKSERIYCIRYGGYGGQTEELWIEHSRYHLDPLLCTSRRYIISSIGWTNEFKYELRHKESLQKVLGEIT